MANFYAKYPSGSPSSTSVATVQGEGTAGTPVGGILTIQGDPSGTPVPVSGSISATNPSVGATGAAVPASGTYVAASVAGTLTGLVATANGLKVDGTATTQPISGTVAATQSGIWSTRTQDGSGTAITSTGSALDVNIKTSSITASTNVAQFGGSNVVTGTGAGGSGIPRVTVSSDSTVGLVAGVAIIGNVRIDQTTPGTTNGVQVNAALPAGTNKIGAITTVDTVTAVTTVSTVTAVTAITNALPAGTNAIGSVIATATAAATFQAEGSIAFGSLTNAYQTIFTPSASTKILQMRNNTNVAVSISFDAGTTLNYVLDAGDTVSLDLVANGLIMTTTAIQAKYTVGAPASGSVRVNGAH